MNPRLPSDFAKRNRNNFNLLRFVAASLVIVSHGFELPTAMAQRDWMFSVTGKTLSWYAVNLFFVISGYLILVSWQRNPSARQFSWARFLRIVPGLLVMLVVTVLILGAGFSDLGFREYVEHKQTLTYFAGCLSILFVKYELPGVFSSNPLHAVNGSLWTLRYEVLCYLCLAVAGTVGLLRHHRLRTFILSAGISVTLVALIVLDILGAGQSDDKLGMMNELARLAMCFQFGALYRQLEDKLPLKFTILVGLTALMILVARTPLFAPVAIATTAYAAIWFAVVPNGKWVAWTRTAPDYSYGIYIYAFPVQQAIISLIPEISPASNIFFGFCVTLVFAALSWHLVEKKALTFKRFRAMAGESELASAAKVAEILE